MAKHLLRFLGIVLLLTFYSISNAKDDAVITFCDGTEMINALYSRIYKEDQGIRTKLASIQQAQKNHAAKDSEVELDELYKEIILGDISNQIVLKQLVKDCGWPKRNDKSFEQGSQIAAAYFVVQHTSQFALQLSYCRMIEDSFRHSDIPEPFFGFYLKRILKHEDRKTKFQFSESIEAVVKKAKLGEISACNLIETAENEGK
jgi:hypothetical protein